MSLNFYAKEEDYGKEESVNNYKNLFSSYKNLTPNLSDSLKQMFKSENLDDKKCDELTKDILDKCKNIIDPKLSVIKQKYKNISKEDAYIICSYTCESNEYIYSPYKILNKNLVSENRKNGIRNISKYLYIFLKSLRKLPKYFPPQNINYLYRCITHKVNLEKDSFNDKLIPYKIGEKKTFWGFTSTSTNPKAAYNFLKNKKEFKSGTVFSLEGDIWGYDIELFNYFHEKEILLEPERKFIVKNVLPPLNEIINIACQIIKSPLIVLDNELEQNNIINNEVIDDNNDIIDKNDIFNNKSSNDKLKEEKFEQKNINKNLSDIYVKKWLDYSSKYGLGYILSNGHVGVNFNDSTKLMYRPNGENFIYRKRYSEENGFINKEHHFTENFDKDLNKKIILLEHFKKYFLGKNENLHVERKKSENIDIFNYVYVTRWLKTKNCILFRLSNKSVQAHFFDESEIFLYVETKLVTYKDTKGKTSCYKLQTALNSDNKEMKIKLKYVKTLLIQLLEETKKNNNH